MFHYFPHTFWAKEEKTRQLLEKTLDGAGSFCNTFFKDEIILCNHSCFAFDSKGNPFNVKSASIYPRAGV